MSYQEGVRHLAAGRAAEAAAVFDGLVRADPATVAAPSGLAAARADMGEERSSVAALDEARRRAVGAPRRDRQQCAVIALALSGDVSRASVLGRDHLSEFPDDDLVRHVLVRTCPDMNDLREAPSATPADGRRRRPRARRQL